MFIELLVCPTPSLSVISPVSRPHSRPRPGVHRAEGADFAPPSSHAKFRSFEGKEAPGALGPVAAEVARVQPRLVVHLPAARTSIRGRQVVSRHPAWPIESPLILAKWGGRRGGRRCVAHVAHAPASTARDVGEPTDTALGTSDRRVSSGGTPSSIRRRTAAWQLLGQSQKRRRDSWGIRPSAGPPSRSKVCHGM